MKKIFTILLVIGLFVLILGALNGCGVSSTASNSAPTPSPTPVPTPVKVENDDPSITYTNNAPDPAWSVVSNVGFSGGTEHQLAPATDNWSTAIIHVTDCSAITWVASSGPDRARVSFEKTNDNSNWSGGWIADVDAYSATFTPQGVQYRYVFASKGEWWFKVVARHYNVGPSTGYVNGVDYFLVEH